MCRGPNPNSLMNTLGPASRMPFHRAVSRVQDVLAQSGFGTAAVVDAPYTTDEHGQVLREPWTIIVVCHVPLTQEIVDEHASMGTAPFFEVMVYVRDDMIHVKAVDPLAIAIGPQEHICLAHEVRARLQGVVAMAPVGEV